MHTLRPTITKFSLLSPISRPAYYPRQDISRAFFNRKRHYSGWIWAPIQPSQPPSLPPPLPELTLEHPDNLPPRERYLLRMKGPYIDRDRLAYQYGRITITSGSNPTADLPFYISTNSTYNRSQKCQLVWDADTKSISLFTESDHPVPGSRRYLKDLLATPNPFSSQILFDFLIKKGYITQEEADKTPRFRQTDYDLTRLQDIGFSQRSLMRTSSANGHPCLSLYLRFQSPDHTQRLRGPRGVSPVIHMELDINERCLAGHSIRVIPHIITNVESGPRLGVHLVEVVGHPNPDFTTVDRPLLLRYQLRNWQLRKKANAEPAESRPLNVPNFKQRQSFLDFIEMVDKHRQLSLS